MSGQAEGLMGKSRSGEEAESRNLHHMDTYTICRALTQVLGTQRRITGHCIACLVMNFAAGRETNQLRCVDICGVDTGRVLTGSEGAAGKVKGLRKQITRLCLEKTELSSHRRAWSPLPVYVTNAFQVCRRLPSRLRTIDFSSACRCFRSIVKAIKAAPVDLKSI